VKIAYKSISETVESWFSTRFESSFVWLNFLFTAVARTNMSLVCEKLWRSGASSHSADAKCRSR